MIAETTRKMEEFAMRDAAHLPVELALDMARIEAEADVLKAFMGQPTDQLFDIRSFYERLVVLLTKIGQFAEAEDKFALLNRLYQLPSSRDHPSLYEARVKSLHLLFLYTAEEREPYYVELASLDPRIAASADVKAIIDFEQLIELGNYQRAFDLIRTLSPSHQALLGRLDEQRRYQNCRMLEHNHPKATVGDLWKILEVKDADDFNKMVHLVEDLYTVI